MGVPCRRLLVGKCRPAAAARVNGLGESALGRTDRPIARRTWLSNLHQGSQRGLHCTLGTHLQGRQPRLLRMLSRHRRRRRRQCTAVGQHLQPRLHHVNWVRGDGGGGGAGSGAEREAPDGQHLGALAWHQAGAGDCGPATVAACAGLIDQHKRHAGGCMLGGFMQGTACPQIGGRGSASGDADAGASSAPRGRAAGRPSAAQHGTGGHGTAWRSAPAAWEGLRPLARHLVPARRRTRQKRGPGVRV